MAYHLKFKTRIRVFRFFLIRKKPYNSLGRRAERQKGENRRGKIIQVLQIMAGLTCSTYIVELLQAALYCIALK